MGSAVGSLVIPSFFTEFTLHGAASDDLASVTCSGAAESPFSALVVTSPRIASITLSRLAFRSCHAPLGGGVLQVNITSTEPLANLAVRIEDCNIALCHALCGGGVLDVLVPNGTVAVTLANSTFISNGLSNAGVLKTGECPSDTDCLMPRGGGAIRLAGHPEHSRLKVVGCVFVNQWAGDGMGGAIFARAASVQVIESQFTACYALYYRPGGAMAVETSALAIRGCTFTGNAGERGGAVATVQSTAWIARSAPLRVGFARSIRLNCVSEWGVQGVVTERNASHCLNLALTPDYTDVTIQGSRFEGNRAIGNGNSSTDGFAVYLGFPVRNVTFDNCTFQCVSMCQSMCLSMYLGFPVRNVTFDNCTFQVCWVLSTVRLNVSINVSFNVSWLPLQCVSMCQSMCLSMYLGFPVRNVTFDNCTFQGPTNSSANVVLPRGLAVLIESSVPEGHISLIQTLFLYNRLIFTELIPSSRAGPSTGAFALYSAPNCSTHLSLSRGCVFEQNYLHSGSSIQLLLSGAALYAEGLTSFHCADTRFQENMIVASRGEAHGAALALVGLVGRAVIERSTFIHQNVMVNINAGGAVYVQGRGQLLISECYFTQNYLQPGATGNSQGGAVAAFGLSALTVQRSLFVDNQISDGQTCRGGALYVENVPQAVLMDSQFSSNGAKSNHGESEGGALYYFQATNQGSETVAHFHMTNCSFDSNVATASNQRVEGGAVILYSLCVERANPELSGLISEIVGCRFTNNQVSGSLDGHGGALYASSGSVPIPLAQNSITIIDCLFTGNSATAYQCNGGAVALLDIGNVTIKGGSFVNNMCEGTQTAVVQGGALFLTQIIVSRNGPSFYALEGVSFNGNSVQATQWTGLGGAVAITDGDRSPFTAVVSVNSCTFWANTIFAPSGSAQGGAFYADHYASLSLNNASFTGNSARSNLAVRGCGLYASSTKGSVAIARSQFDGNSACADQLVPCGNVLGAGAYLEGTTALDRIAFVGNQIFSMNTATGGGLYISGPATTIIGQHLRFEGNIASSDIFAAGGGLHINGQSDSPTRLTNITFLANRVLSKTGTGGGCGLEGVMHAELAEVLFDGNTVTASLSATGGALMTTSPPIHPTRLFLTHVRFHANSAPCPGCMSRGGAAAFLEAAAVLNDVSFVGAPRQGQQTAAAVYEGGGCLFATGPSREIVQLTNVSFTSCQAQTGGGAVLSGSRFLLRDCLLADCMADLEGGGLALSAQVELDHLICRGCSAGKGGCLSATEGSVQLTSAQFTRCQATESGGAIAMSNASLSLDNVVGSDNRAGKAGGVIAAQLSLVCVSASGWQLNEVWGWQLNEVSLHASHFERNWAQDGGVLHGSESTLSSDGAEYLGNGAISGAVWYVYGGRLQSTHDQVVNARIRVADTQFQGNTANQGGVLRLSGDQTVAHILRSQFHNNSATNGGVLTSWLSGEWLIAESNFTHNLADSGGAIMGVIQQPVIMIHCRFGENQAMSDGAAVLLTSVRGAHPLVNMSRTVFTGQRFVYSTGAPLGAALALGKVDARLDEVDFSDNLGGAIFMNTGEVTVGAGSHFSIPAHAVVYNTNA
ncbi:hypothetical protein PAPYR_9326 [Paratrimastix pyriformis]|uniref:Adhesin-like protein n=1 Tax=Paratrimastix pyriformis TaxID=342808 RepID=A0ABQ8UE85_9EUKA|nr:hypothetical protein PAPYR_9326 [Paratrimastix pyriformis]